MSFHPHTVHLPLQRRTQSLCQEDSSWARQAPPGVRSELALIPAPPPRNHGEVGWSMIGVVNGCVRERAPPATGSSYPSLRKIMRSSKMKKRMPWREERNKEEGEAKKKKDQVVPGGVLKGGGQATATHTTTRPPRTNPRKGLHFALSPTRVLCIRSHSFWGQHRAVLISVPGLEDRAGCLQEAGGTLGNRVAGSPLPSHAHTGSSQLSWTSQR